MFVVPIKAWLQLNLILNDQPKGLYSALTPSAGYRQNIDIDV